MMLLCQRFLARQKISKISKDIKSHHKTSKDKDASTKSQDASKKKEMAMVVVSMVKRLDTARK